MAMQRGIVGLRLFPNPAFDEEAAKKWDPKRYYEDPTYYLSKDLVKPYRVGMSCAFCHVGPNPAKPPENPEHPEWKHLSSNVGAQYFWIDRIFAWEADETSFPYQLFRTSRPGSLDTSLISTDNINNPRTMNAVYHLGPRLDQAKRWGQETLAGGNLDNKQFNNYVASGPLTTFYQPPDTVWTPRVLKDGSDSVGALGALNRVFLNIGLFSEEWLLHFKPLIGGEPITPIKIRDARNNSSYWGATEAQTPNLALFFLKTTASTQIERCSWRKPVSDNRCFAAPAWQGSVCRTLRALPFQQTSRSRQSVSILTAAQERAIWTVGTSTGTGRRPRSSNEK